MDADDHVARLEPVHLRDAGIVNLGYVLHLEIMVARTERAHLVALALLGMGRDVAGLGVRHPAVLLDTIEIGGGAEAPFDGPLRAAREHGVHLVRVQAEGAGAADAGGNLAVERLGQRLLRRQDVVLRQPGMQAAYPAGNVEAHAAGRNHTACVRVERGHAADGKAVTPVGIGHGVRRLDDAREHGDVDRLFVDLLVHVADELFAGINHRRHAHGAVGRDFPFVFGASGEKRGIHVSYTSTTVCAHHSPFASRATRNVV